jgi:hypothetical protein
MSEVIAAQTSPVSLVVTGDDLSKKVEIMLNLKNSLNIRYNSSV